VNGLNELSAHEAARRIRDGEITSEALVRDCLHRITKNEHSIHAWQHVDTSHALHQARTCDTMPAKGVLHGVPIGIKDLIDTADMPTCYGSNIYAGYQPKRDAECVKRLRDSGAVILGKTVTTEFATFKPPLTRNPHDLNRTPGGSSSGSAAAVSDQMVPLALGTQTAGSVIRPAAFCGVVGFKPTFGYCSTTGVKTLSNELDTLGMFARDTRDTALLATCLGRAGTALLDAGRKPSRIGLFRGPNWDQVDAPLKTEIEKVCEIIGRSKVSVVTQASTDDFSDLLDVQHTIMCADMAESLAPEFGNHYSELSKPLQQLIEYGLGLDDGKIKAARECARLARVEVEKLFGDCSFLITPSAPGEAPGMETTGTPLFNKIWTLLHLPCLNLPIGCGPGSLPLSIQLVARANDEATLLGGAAWVEKVLAERS